MDGMKEPTVRGAVIMVAAICIIILLLFGTFVGGCTGYKAWHRSQQRADANNQVKITAIKIRQAAQQARIVHAQIQTTAAQAQQRFVAATGVRRAQDEIAKTLTPLYVQFEAIEAQKAIATSGQNNTVIYVPASTNGTPIITQAAPGSESVAASGHGK